MSAARSASPADPVPPGPGPDTAAGPRRAADRPPGAGGRGPQRPTGTILNRQLCYPPLFEPYWH